MIDWILNNHMRRWNYNGIQYIWPNISPIALGLIRYVIKKADNLIEVNKDPVEHQL